jgi:hypothetical protein
MNSNNDPIKDAEEKDKAYKKANLETLIKSFFRYHYKKGDK